jgi:hypothetical protein
VSRRRFAAIIIPVALIASLLTTVTAPAQPAVAAVGSQFNPGNIISDAVMYNGSAMSANDVQQFLVSKVPTCRSSYACLKSYSQATPTMAASAYCSTYQGAAGESAAAIIAKVGAACNISQKSLLVLLEKEQSLVTSSTPGSGQFASATGFGCPDTAPCDPSVGGFFYQVYYAARQFQIYATKPLSFNYQAGRYNNILFNPKPVVNGQTCGSSAVFIQNKATAGLYDYTPYQPNAAALANLYGGGDNCSSFGNRNFWRLFTDWFGSTTGPSSLARTLDNATVYVLSGTVKYPIASLGVLSALAPLGAISYVSQTYLDGFTSGPLAGRILRASNGTIYFFDSGVKLPFMSCGLVADYGGSCDATGYMQLTDTQLALFATGPAMGPVLGTVEGARYYVTAGTKREILDDQSQLAAGIPLGYNLLTEAALAGLPFAAPVIRDSAFIQQRGSSQYFLAAGGNRYSVNAAAMSAAGLPGRSAGTLYASSIGLVPDAGTKFNGLVKVAGSTTNVVLAGGSRYEWTGGPGASMPAVPVAQAFVDSYPLKATITVGSFIKSDANPTVYVVGPSDIKGISSWDTLLSLTSPGTSPVISTVPSSVIDLLPQGPVALGAGTLARSPNNATIYLINGLTNRIPISSFDMSAEAGITGFSVVSDAYLAAYPLATAALGYGVTCAAKNYVSAAGSIHEVTAALASLYPVNYASLDAYTCARLTVGSVATHFIRTSNGSIYQLVAGQRLPIGSMARYQELGGPSEGYLSVSNGFAAAIPVGPAA